MKFWKHKSIVPFYKTIQAQFTLTLLIFVLVCSLLLSIISYTSFKSILVEEIGYNRVDTLTQVGKQAAEYRITATAISNLLYYDNELDNYLSDESNYTTEEILDYIEQLTEHIQDVFALTSYDLEIVLIGDDDLLYCSSGSSDYPFEYVRSRIWYANSVDSSGEIQWIANYHLPNETQSMYSAARVINGENDSQTLLLINIKESLLQNTYNDLVTTDNYIYIVDNEGTVVSSNKTSLVGLKFFSIDGLMNLFDSEPYTLTQIAGRDVLFTYYYDSVYDWYILEEIPQEEILMPVHVIRNFLMISTFTIAISGIIIAFISAKKIASPILKLYSYIKQINAEELDSECHIEGPYELMVLNDGITGMLKRINKLLTDTINQEQQKRKIELSLLQSQINPHFICNTLFSVKCMVEMDKNQDASNMLTSFIHILRNTLSNPNEFVSLHEEFEMLEKYVDLQQYLYNHSFSADIYHEENIQNCKLPKLLLQPLLENAIFHGVATRKNGLISIYAYEDNNNNIIVQVNDNGVGMEDERIQQIDKGSTLTKTGGFGLSNIKERMILFFGDTCSFKISSEKGSNTTITLSFPKLDQ